MIEKLRYEDIETAFLVTFAVVFFFLERFYPKHKNLNTRSFLKLDIQAFIILVIGINLSRIFILSFYQKINLGSLLYLQSAESWPFVIKIFIAHLISDFILYWTHRGMHSVNFLWKTHQWHHSSEALYWFSGFRTSLMHVFLYAFPQVLVGFVLFHFTPLELGIGFGLGVISNLFTHSNIRLPEWIPLHRLIVTPDFHHPHHSQLGTQNKNFGNVFTFWDQIFKTYVSPKRIRKDFKYGLKEKPSNWRMMIGL